jgi:hypothetical protein
MKKLKIAPVLLLVIILSSCTSVRVATDYDREADFSSYTSYAFYKPGIDQAEISTLDKKRILRAINSELAAKGLNKNESPDLLVSIFTQERQRVDVYNDYYGWGWGWGWGWNPYWNGGWGNTVSTSTEGSLFIDLIDAKKNELVWQGIGTAQLITSGNVDKKEKRIREIVQKILMKYPPDLTKKK